MSYGSILVYVDDPTVATGALKAASRIATDHQAHLSAIYVVPPLAEYTALDLPVPQLAVDGFMSLQKERAAVIEDVFRQQTAGQSFSAEWRFIDTCSQPVVEAVANMANAFDLLVVGVSDEMQGPNGRAGTADKVMLSCARPVLIVPTDVSVGFSFNRVLVAYDQSAQSSRAIFNAMPMLKRAGSVTLQRLVSSEFPFALSSHIWWLSQAPRKISVRGRSDRCR